MGTLCIDLPVSSLKHEQFSVFIINLVFLYIKYFDDSTVLKIEDKYIKILIAGTV